MTKQYVPQQPIWKEKSTMLSTSWIERRLNEADAYNQQLLEKLLEVEKDVKEKASVNI